MFSLRMRAGWLLLCAGLFFGVQHYSALAIALVPSATDVAITSHTPLPVMQTVSVVNDSSVRHDYRSEVLVVDFTEEGEVRGFYALPRALEDWFEVTPTAFSLEPAAEQALQVAIHPTFDERWRHVTLALVVRETAFDGDSVRFSPGVTSMFFITIGDDVVASAVLTDITATDYDEGASTLISLAFRNTGDFPFIPAGLLTVTDMFGTEVARVLVNGAQKRIPFATSRTLFEIWHHGDPTAHTFFQKAYRQISHFYLGRYTISFTMPGADSSGASQVSSATVWLWPYELFVSGGCLIVFVLLGVLFWRRFRLKM